MASEVVATQEQNNTPLEDKVADLSLQEKAGVIADAVNEYVEGVKEAAKISAEDMNTELKDSAEETNEKTKDSQEQPSQDAHSREVNIAEKEAQKSSDEGAYVVSTVDHRSVQEPGSEEKVDVPTGVVHENADPVEKPQQQGKGLIQSITQSVKSVFSGFTGGKGKSPDLKGKETTEY